MSDHFDSASARRTENNVMRHEYRQLTQLEKDQMKAVKDAGAQFLDLLHDVGDTNPQDGRQRSRELSLAQTKIEEAVMWAVKHVTK